MRRLLVANRGEIAVRIMDSAALMGIECVAIYPDDDRTSAHVSKASDAVRIAGAGPAAYLDVEAIVAAAIEARCDALHPGLGFLSESADLARACGAAEITFVGPPADALHRLGDKALARQLAARAGLPMLKASEGDISLEQAIAAMRTGVFGKALMVKAVSGGGGRGMAIVREFDELRPAYQRCAGEAQAAFGSPELYLEQFLDGAHHVEVQIVADSHGDVAAVGDRDCSVQRRRQKLIEIAPAPWISAELREQLHRAAEKIISQLPYCGLATVEFLVSGDEFYFLEVNPRIQVEHTVTEQVTGLDLVAVGLHLVNGANLSELGIRRSPTPQGFSVQARVNAETLSADGTVVAGGGTFSRFQPPSGRGVRVDTHGYLGYAMNPRYDSLVAKVIADGPDLDNALTRLDQALAGFDVAGVPVNVAALRALLADPQLALGDIDTNYVDRNVAGIVARAADYISEPVADAITPALDALELSVPDGAIAVLAPMQAVVVEVGARVGDIVSAGDELLVLEAMKMQHVVSASSSGVVRAIGVSVGDVVQGEQAIAVLDPTDDVSTQEEAAARADLDQIRPDLQESIDRHHVGLDEGREEAVAKWHAKGRRTARENIADLVDDGSFIEYGALALAAQRRRRSLDDLIARTTGDGIVLGTATINGMPVAVMSYDYLVMAGTQGLQNHRKTDRFLEVAGRQGLPVVMFAEGGGGRPGDTDHPYVAQLEVPTFRTLASLVGTVPIVCVVSGYCFAGNAALVGCADIVIATEDANLGMGGPAMIEGGGLGVYAPTEVGPTDVQFGNGVIDVLVTSEAEAVDCARRAVSLLCGRSEHSGERDQRVMRHLIPENRLRSYDVRPVMETLVDDGSLIELRGGYGAGVVTGIASIDGMPVGIVANNSRHLGGAIDHDASEKAARFFGMCNDHGLPLISLCDTPGFMVGPDSETYATVRKFGSLFVAGARLKVPVVAVVLRKAYGLGAMAMVGGSMHAPVLTVSWPTGEFGGMGLEGAVRLGYRKELDAIADPTEQQHRYEELVAEHYEKGKALSTAAAFEIDDVIDPADTRRLVAQALTRSGA